MTRVRSLLAFVLGLALLPAAAGAQDGDPFGIDVVRGLAAAEAGGMTVTTEIDPSGFAPPLTIVRGRVLAAPTPVASTDAPDGGVVVVIGTYPYRALWWHGLWSVPGRPLHNPWYAWMGSFQESLAEDIAYDLRY